jgi:hypothetical protein
VLPMAGIAVGGQAPDPPAESRKPAGMSLPMA